VGLVAALLAGLAVLCFALGFVHRNEARARAPLLAVAEATGSAPGRKAAAARGPGARKRRSLPPPLGYIDRRARTAGVEWDLSAVLALILGFGVGGALLIFLSTGVAWITGVAFCAGFYAPIWRLERLARQRAQQVLRQLDQVCTELIQALSGGLDIHAALLRQAERAPDPVGRELRRVMQRVREGEPLGDAVVELPERIALEEVRLFSVGVRLALDAGTRVVPVLESIQRSLRGRREMQGLIRELSARDEKQSLILFFVPVAMILAMRLEAPQYTAPLLGSAAGQTLLLADLLWMVFGMQMVRGFFAGTPLR
jgi:Flp pilus assembly protein TadB